MAVTSTIAYCTDTNLLEVYPGLVGYDSKRRIYGWTEISTDKYAADSTGVVNQLFMNGEHLGSAQSDNSAVNASLKWYYSSQWDRLYFQLSGASPNDKVMEGGEDWTTIKQTMRRRASRMVESLLDSRMAREIMKDREGNYPEFIIRATSLKAITLLMRSHDPENPVVESFEQEFNEIIEGYRSGAISLPNSVTMDSSKGVIREVSVDSSTDLFPVELLGNYGSFGYDNIKLKVTSAGTIGNARYSVWTKDTNELKKDLVVDNELITGDYDIVHGGLYVRWAGDNDAAAAVLNDEYEIEVKSSLFSSSMSKQGSIRLSRRYG
tara:strand:+ start:9891 stop:10856 length:966 start_codon:yes stop_codon:yes gene_type:complete